MRVQVKEDRDGLEISSAYIDKLERVVRAFFLLQPCQQCSACHVEMAANTTYRVDDRQCWRLVDELAQNRQIVLPHKIEQLSIGLARLA